MESGKWGSETIGQPIKSMLRVPDLHGTVETVQERGVFKAQTHPPYFVLGENRKKVSLYGVLPTAP